MSELQKILQPKSINTDNSLIRLGRNGDGGYIIDKNTCNNIQYCYSYGIADEISFEYDLFAQNHKAVIYLFDHTIDKPKPLLPTRMIFEKCGLSSKKEGDLNTFFNHLNKNNHENDLDKILLKLDCEGAEYELFKEDCEKLSNVRSLVVEFHSIYARLDEFKNIIKKLNNFFDIIHVHGNNCGYTFNSEGFYFSDTPEITFLNKKFNTNSDYIKISYPVKDLDYPNDSNKEDIKFYF